MDWKNKGNLIINNDMRYFMIDKNYNPNAWDDMIDALSSESQQVKDKSNSDLITYLKANIKDIEFDDLMPLYDALTDNERFGRHVMSDDEMLKMIKGDES